VFASGARGGGQDPKSFFNGLGEDVRSKAFLARFVEPTGKRKWKWSKR